jgi:hypothetical protein
MKATLKTVSKITNAIDSTLAAKRHEVAESQLRQYGAERDYAKTLNDVFKFNWFEFEASDTSDEGKVIKTEKKALYAELKAANHTNPSTVWARVKKYGEQERFPERFEKSESDTVEGEQGESGKDNANRSPMLRNIEELTTLYKFNMKQENLADKIVKANAHIMKALQELGVQVNML